MTVLELDLRSSMVVATWHGKISVSRTLPDGGRVRLVLTRDDVFALADCLRAQGFDVGRPEGGFVPERVAHALLHFRRPEAGRCDTCFGPGDGDRARPSPGPCDEAG